MIKRIFFSNNDQKYNQRTNIARNTEIHDAVVRPLTSPIISYFHSIRLLLQSVSEMLNFTRHLMLYGRKIKPELHRPDGLERIVEYTCWKQVAPHL